MSFYLILEVLCWVVVGVMAILLALGIYNDIRHGTYLGWGGPE